MMKKFIWLAVCLLLVCGRSVAMGDTLYRHLAVGNAGDDVQAMKERLYDLGYYTTTKLTGSYTEAVSGVVKQFQKNKWAS